GRGDAPPLGRRRPEWVAGASPRPRRPLATRTASAGRAVTLRAVTLRAVTLRAVTLRAVTLRAVTLRAVTLRAPRELAVPRPTRRRWPAAPRALAAFAGTGSAGRPGRCRRRAPGPASAAST